MFPNASPAELRDAAALYNDYEKLRDPSHVRCLALAEWLTLLIDAGFIDRRHEQLDQDIDFVAWTARMRCSEPTIARLAAMLTREPLRTFLSPRAADGERVFTLQEAIIVARKPE
jgi:hypothetical protein